MVTRSARARLRFAGPVAALAILTSLQAVASGQAANFVRAEFIDRFLAPDRTPLVSYKAFRHLTASTRGGKMTASIDAWTRLDPILGFTYEITKREGSALIQNKVLVAALEAEMDAVKATDRGQSALTPANYEFLDINQETARLVKMDVRPRRKHVMLVNGALIIEADSADLVRIDGDLSKRPSFWTRRVHVVREYERLEGVHVPVGMSSTADVLIVGSSTFAMTYRYSEINGKTVPEK